MRVVGGLDRLADFGIAPDARLPVMTDAYAAEWAASAGGAMIVPYDDVVVVVAVVAFAGVASVASVAGIERAVLYDIGTVELD